MKQHLTEKTLKEEKIIRRKIKKDHFLEIEKIWLISERKCFFCDYVILRFAVLNHV